MLGTMPVLTQDQIDRFNTDGVIHLPGLFSPTELDRCRTAIEEIKAKPGPLGADFALPGEGSFFAEHFARLHNPVMEEISRDSIFPELAGRLMGARTVHLAWDHVFVKEPHTKGESHWHQDQPYAWVDGQQNVSFWLALDQADKASGVVQFVPGSHRWGKWYQPKSFDPRKNYAGQEYEPMPDISADPERFGVVWFDCAPGDVIAFHLAIVHYAPGNATDRRRRAISIRYAGDDATFAVRARGPKLPYDPGLAHGAPLSGDLFPVVWRDPAAAAA